MSITPESIQQQWTMINPVSGGFLRIATPSQLEWYIGYYETTQKVLLLLTNSEPQELPSSRSILVRRRRRSDHDQRWTLTFELIRPQQNNVFHILCWDMIVCTEFAQTEAEALAALRKRYAQWSILLEHQHDAIMSEPKQKGLYGELLFLNERLTQQSHDALSVLQGWVGPDGHAQDFVYSDAWYEVKTTGKSHSSITISSLEQLDSSMLGYLVIMYVDVCVPAHHHAQTLVELISVISQKLGHDAESLDLFAHKLVAYGYLDLSVYTNTHYHWSGHDSFHVDETFPKLAKNTVPSQVIATTYTLAIAGLNDWKE